MEVDRPAIRAADLDRVALWVSEPLSALAHTYASKYIRWGAKQTFESKKSKAVTVPERSTCAARPLWYDLTNDKIGTVFWPKTQKYRHIVPANPDSLVCNCNLYMIVPESKSPHERQALTAILNSTVVALMKCFYGRYVGAEGTLKTEIVDMVLLEVPDPRGISPALGGRITKALEKMTKREVTHLVGDTMLQCHSEELMRQILAKPPELPTELKQPDRRELDDCVLELIGVANPKERERLLDELYLETTKYYCYQRTQDIQAMEDRAGNNGRRLGAHDLAESIWHSLSDAERGVNVPEWVSSVFRDVTPVEIPEGTPLALGASDMFHPNAVIFKSGKDARQVDYASSEQAALVAAISRLGIHGEIRVPESATDCRACLAQLENRLTETRMLFAKLAGSRTGTQSLLEKTTAVLLHWHTLGKPSPGRDLITLSLSPPQDHSAVGPCS